MEEASRRSAAFDTRDEKGEEAFAGWITGVLADHLEIKTDDMPLCIEIERKDWFSRQLEKEGRSSQTMVLQESDSIRDFFAEAFKLTESKKQPVFVDDLLTRGFMRPLVPRIDASLRELALSKNPRVIQTSDERTPWRDLLLCPLAQSLAGGNKAIVAISEPALFSPTVQEARKRLIGSGIVERILYFPFNRFITFPYPTTFIVLSRGNEEIVFEDYRPCMRYDRITPSEPIKTVVSIDELLLDADTGLDCGSLDYRMKRPSYAKKLGSFGITMKSGYRLFERRRFLVDGPAPDGKKQERFRYVSTTDFKDGVLTSGGSHIDVRALCDYLKGRRRASSEEEVTQDLKNNHALKAGDILVQRVVPGVRGEVILILQIPEDETLVPSDNITVIRCNDPNALDPAYLSAYLSGEYGVKLIGAKAGQKRLFHFSARDFQDLPLHMPSHEEQEEIGSQYREVTEQIAEHYREIERLLAERDKIVEKAAGPGKDE